MLILIPAGRLLVKESGKWSKVERKVVSDRRRNKAIGL
jgi:hypothetical protein